MKEHGKKIIEKLPNAKVKENGTVKRRRTILLCPVNAAKQEMQRGILFEMDVVQLPACLNLVKASIVRLKHSRRYWCNVKAYYGLQPTEKSREVSPFEIWRGIKKSSE